MTKTKKATDPDRAPSDDEDEAREEKSHKEQRV